MIFQTLTMLVPHLCLECDKIGEILCDYCKYNIENDTFIVCVGCGGRPACHRSACTANPYERAWVVASYQTTVQHLIKSFKSQRVVESLSVAGHLLHRALPLLPSTTIVTSPPTLRRHIRQRGYDHVESIATFFATHRGLPYRRLFIRTDTSVQKGATRQERLSQAQRSSSLIPLLAPPAQVLIIDDVITTGATVAAAARLLRDAGVKSVWIAALAYQPLDESCPI